MIPVDGLDLEALLATPIRLRATAAALAMVVAGHQPSLSRVADLAGVSRQALHKDHQPLVEFVAKLRAEWKPKVDHHAAHVQKERDDALAALAAERRKRIEAERQRDRALHHLELCDATVKALSAGTKNISSGRF